ncbi:hypothetical protein ACHAWO_010078 [Cyclotella atomus]|uniref:Orc1-like AAA ATPase domain-containing protein n=1 Tax=Cyclotella atomus TaxID=382360 RepID=A0ABD3MYR6_9STRA
MKLKCGDYIHSLMKIVKQDLNGNRAITDGIAGVDLHATVDDVPCVATVFGKGDGHGDVHTDGYVHAGAFNRRQSEIACNWPEETINNLKVKLANQGAPGTMNRSSSSKTVALSLSQWIPHAVKASGSNGYASPLYVASAMKIALAITKDIVEAESLYTNYCIPDKLDMMPLSAAHEWAQHVVVELNSTQLKDPAIDCRAADAQGFAGSNQDDMVEEFLKQFEQQRILRQEQARRDQAQASGQGRTAEVGATARNSNLEDVDWLKVKSARIKCPEGNLRNNHDNGSKQRIFYLGLLLYELFSGGQTPPPNLCALASSIGAFVSISKMSLAQRTNNEDRAASTGKRLQSVNQDGGLCKVNCEYLKLINVTNSLCHLIFHMLDCVYGDFADEDSYSHLTEVEFDLQLMIDQPKFLLGLDMDTSSQLSDISISREEEVQTILSCYRRSISIAPEIAIVKGVSGAAALDQYCDVLISQLGSYWVNTVVNNLQTAFGRDASYLMVIIPKLSVILGNANHPPPVVDGDLRNAVQRIQYLLCQFIETISSSSMVSVTICLDDVQWIDNASIEVMRRLLGQAYSKFFFMACFRHDEMSSTHSFWSMIESARSRNVFLTSVELKNVDTKTLENCMSDMLCISPRLVKPLASIVHTKTKGLPLFVSEMLRSLVRDGLLRVDLDSQRWVWDRDKIYAAKLPDNVVVCLTNSIAKLPSEVQLALNALSMFGSSVNSEYIKALETQLDINLTEHLKVAINEGLVSEIKGSYQFSHDSVQENCYSMIREKDCKRKHLVFGRCLAELAMETNSDDVMFTSVTQINLGGPAAVTEWDDYLIMAKHNLAAGKKAIETSDFSLAYNLFHNGVKFLPPQHWHHHPAIGLELHECAARAALATGNIDNTRWYSEIVMGNTECIDDKLYIQHIVMLSLMHTSKINEALELGLGILSQLGEGISRNSAEDDFVEQRKRTQTMIVGVTEDDILSYGPMIDTRKQAAMKFLASLYVCFSSFYKLLVSFLFRRDDTQECGKTYYELDERSAQSVLSELVIRALPPGLAAFRLYRETKDSVWLKRGQKCKQKMQVWSEQGCKWNFEQKLLLLMAEESYCLCDYAAAKEYYKKAIAAAKSHKFLNDECFALELAADFYFETGDLTVSLEHFKAAHNRYCDWGAYAKANELFQQINAKFASGLW